MTFSGRSICIVGVNYAPEITGIAPYTTALARHLVGLGAQVHVVTGVPHYPEWAVQRPYGHGFRWEEVDYGVRLTRRRHVVPRSQGLAGRAMFEATFAAMASSAVLRSSSDVVIAVTPAISAAALGALSGVLRRRPLGVLVQDLTGNAATQSGTTGSRVGSMIARAEYGLLRRADLVGVITPRFGEIAIENGVAPDRVVSLPNFTHIQPSPLSKAAARAALGWPQHRVLAVHTGNMGMKQGLEVVVEAAALAATTAPDVDFILVGDGNQRGDLERRAVGLSNIRFVDPLDADLYAHALAAADVLLVNERASVREMSLPSKLTSYFVAGRPVIAAVVPGGITEQVAMRSGACLVIPAGEPESLLAAVVRINGDQALATQLVAAASRFAEAELSAAAALARYSAFAQRLFDLAAVRSR